jgi:hypothetical protein
LLARPAGPSVWAILTSVGRFIVSNLLFMLDDPLHTAANLPRSGPALSDVIDEARDTADGAEGADETGMVRVRLGLDGFPGQLWVDPDWQSRLPPERVGDAVTQACRAAAASRAERLLHAMSDDDWTYRVQAAARRAGPLRPPRGPDLARQRQAARAATRAGRRPSSTT